MVGEGDYAQVGSLNIFLPFLATTFDNYYLYTSKVVATFGASNNNVVVAMPYRPMLLPFEAQPGPFSPPRPRRVTRKYPKSTSCLAALCPAGHALTLAQVTAGGVCPLCAAR